MEKIKVLALIGSFPTKINPSAAIFVLNQLEHMKKHCQFKVVVPYAYVPNFKHVNPFYRFSKIPLIEDISGIEVYRPRYLQISRFFLFSPILRSAAMLIETANIYLSAISVVKNIEKKWKFDVIHIHGPISEGVLGVSAKRMYKKPLAITFHGEDATILSKMGLLKFVCRRTLKNCDAFIFVTGYLQKALGQKLPGEKVAIIPSGYMVSRFKPMGREKCAKRLGLPKRRKTIIFVGGFTERKGVEYLLKAVGIASKQGNDITCLMVGGGKLMKKLQSLAQNLGIGGNVIFAGYRAPDEVPLWINASDLLVLPSLDEGLPNVVVEALACGKPVVATNVGGIPDVVNDDVGYLVRPKDENELAKKIIMALERKWDRKKLMRRARQFSVAKSAKKLVDVYKNMLKIR
ncbi:glycosyltransferase family 4 protein [Candidatus Woesearchaeota archaeon]|nr:glycosyltransferase family 4 protein [Candidatus Woesearchaeota archaeon]